MDALSAALSSVQMTGAIFFNALCRAPWGFFVPPLQDVAHVLAPGTERLIGYHLVVEGEALARFDDGRTVSVSSGDVVVVPHGHAHTVTNGVPEMLTDTGATIRECLAGNLKAMEIGGDGEATHLICGHFGCQRHAGRLFLSGLPAVIKVNISGDPAGEWLKRSVLHLVSDSQAGRPGQSALLSRMAEALFIEALRRYTEQIPPEQEGWLAGARDPVVGAALSLLHEQPARNWTLADLSEAAGASRSVLTERFTRILGEPPLAYLASWRLLLAARVLETTNKKVAQVAWEAGYDSEAAFNRAFKREHGLPPARYRRQKNRTNYRAARKREVPA